MQISRHWRMNAQRYRLEGYRYSDGEVSLQERPRTEMLQEDTVAARAEQEADEKAAVPAA
jgi:hypothetical protein